MKFRTLVLTFVLCALSTGVWAQCSNPTQKPMWDADKSQFKCVDPSHPDAVAKQDSLQPTGDKAYCSSVRDNLEAVCAPSNEGKACRSEAKSISNACNKRAKSESESQKGSFGSGSPAGKTDASTCMTTFQQQQQACNTRKLPPPAPGQTIAPDTCLQDALAAQSKCLANSH